MRRIKFLAPLCGLGLLVGCSTQDRVERHQKNAADDYRAAREELRKGQESAQKDVAKADDNAAAKMKDAREEKLKAADNRLEMNRDRSIGNSYGERQLGERQPVAGREWMPLEKSVRDELGDDWRYEHDGMKLVAVRMKVKKADDKLNSKISDEIRSLREDRKGATATQNGSEVVVRGTMDECKDAANAADKFAKIDGVNRIVIEMSCLK